MVETDDTALVEALRAGSEQAFEELVRVHAPRLLATTRRLLRDEGEANDAVQDAFLSAFKALDGFQGQSKLSTWLHRIAVNAALMRLRRRTRRPHEETGAPDDAGAAEFDDTGHRVEAPTPWSDPEAEAERAELRERVRESIDELSETHRTVILLRDIEGLSTEEVAAALEITPNAVKVRLHRARHALRELLAPRFQESSP